MTMRIRKRKDTLRRDIRRRSRKKRDIRRKSTLKRNIKKDNRKGLIKCPPIKKSSENEKNIKVILIIKDFLLL